MSANIFRGVEGTGAEKIQGAIRALEEHLHEQLVAVAGTKGLIDDLLRRIGHPTKFADGRSDDHTVIHAAAVAIAMKLMTDSSGQRARRLVLEGDTGGDLGGMCFVAVIDTIERGITAHFSGRSE